VKKAWDRIDGEPQMWFSRFEKFYLVLGTERSLHAAYQNWRVKKSTVELNGNGKIDGISGSWQKASKNWKWKDRAEVWDAEQREQRLKEEEELRLEMRKRRRTLLGGFIAKYANLLQQFELRDNPSLSEMTKGLDTAIEQMRKEYDDLPMQRVNVSGNITFADFAKIAKDRLEEIKQDE